MMLEELIIEKIRKFPHLFDLSSESYKNIDLKNNDWQNIANEINDQCITHNPDGTTSRSNVQVAQLITTWQNLWSNFKEFSRKDKTVKTGDAPAKELDPTKKMLMEKMKYFEPYVVDLFSNVRTSSTVKSKSKTTSSVWAVQEKTSAKKEMKRKIPPPSNHYNTREDKKERMFKLVEDLAAKVCSITEQSQELISNNREKIVSNSASSEDQTRKALLNIVDKFFINLTPDSRSLCLAEMLDALTCD